MTSPEQADAGTGGWYSNPTARGWTCAPAPAEAFVFHQQMPGYRPTPLVEAPVLAAELSVGRVFVKDESARFDLGAFKFLGASWAAMRLVSRLSGYTGPASLRDLRDWLDDREPIALVTATDGNHGRAVSRVASLLGLTAHVYVPGVVPGPVLDRITAEGAELTVVAGNYDDAVAAARTEAESDLRAALIQDTSWDGYTEVPAWTVEGYSTLLWEVDVQLAEYGVVQPDVVSVPVGVGSLAQAAVIHYRSRQRQPVAAVLSVEADTAACVLKNLTAGRLHTVPTALTIMNGLNCGTPSLIAWPFLVGGLDAAVAVTDDQARQAVTDLLDAGVVSGPSGAASLAGACAALSGEGSTDRRSQLDVDADAVVVCISTEGFAGVPQQ